MTTKSDVHVYIKTKSDSNIVRGHEHRSWNIFKETNNVLKPFNRTKNMLVSKKAYSEALLLVALSRRGRG